MILRTGEQLPHVPPSRHYVLVHKHQGRGCPLFEPACLDMHSRLITQKGEAGSPCRSSTWLDTQTRRSQVGNPKLTLEPYKWDQSCWETCMVLDLILAKGGEGRNPGIPGTESGTNHWVLQMTKTIPVSIVLNMVGQGQLPQKLGFGVRNFSRLSGHVCETAPHGGGDGLRLGQLLPSVLVGFWHFSFPVSQDCFLYLGRCPQGQSMDR